MTRQNRINTARLSVWISVVFLLTFCLLAAPVSAQDLTEENPQSSTQVTAVVAGEDNPSVTPTPTVEPSGTPAPTNPTSTPAASGSGGQTSAGNVKTGDATPVGWLAVSLTASGILLLFLFGILLGQRRKQVDKTTELRK